MTADRVRQRHQSVDHGVHMPQIRAVFALLLRSSDTEEVHVGELSGGIVVGGESQAARSDVVAQHLSQAGFIERNVTGGELGDLPGVDVDTDHVVPEFGHSGGMSRTEIARAEDCASHTTSLGSRDELTATRHLAAHQR